MNKTQALELAREYENVWLHAKHYPVAVTITGKGWFSVMHRGGFGRILPVSYRAPELIRRLEILKQKIREREQDPEWQDVMTEAFYNE